VLRSGGKQLGSGTRRGCELPDLASLGLKRWPQRFSLQAPRAISATVRPDTEAASRQLDNRSRDRVRAWGTSSAARPSRNGGTSTRGAPGCCRPRRPIPFTGAPTRAAICRGPAVARHGQNPSAGVGSRHAVARAMPAALGERFWTAFLGDGEITRPQGQRGSTAGPHARRRRRQVDISGLEPDPQPAWDLDSRSGNHGRQLAGPPSRSADDSS